MIRLQTVSGAALVAAALFAGVNAPAHAAVDTTARIFETLIKAPAKCAPEQGEDAGNATRMTRLTCGLMEINARLKALHDTVGADLVATVDEDHKHLRISGTSINGLHATADNCKDVVDGVRYDAGVDSRKGWLLTDYATRYTWSLLGDGPRSSKRAATEKALDNALLVDVTIQYHDEKVACSGPIMGTQVTPR